MSGLSIESTWAEKIWFVILALQLSLLNLPVCQGLCQLGGVVVLGGHTVMGHAASVQVLSFLVWTGCYGFFHTSQSNRFDPRILLGMPSLPEGFQLIFPALQFELGASREDPDPNSCLRIIPVPSNHPILKSSPKSLILISGPLTYFFYQSLGLAFF